MESLDKWSFHREKAFPYFLISRVAMLDSLVDKIKRNGQSKNGGRK
jgi:hypothetical protein